MSQHLRHSFFSILPILLLGFGVTPLMASPQSGAQTTTTRDGFTIPNGSQNGSGFTLPNGSQNGNKPQNSNAPGNSNGNGNNQGGFAYTGETQPPLSGQPKLPGGTNPPSNGSGIPSGGQTCSGSSCTPGGLFGGNQNGTPGSYNPGQAGGFNPGNSPGGNIAHNGGEIVNLLNNNGLKFNLGNTKEAIEMKKVQDEAWLKMKFQAYDIHETDIVGACISLQDSAAEAIPYVEYRMPTHIFEVRGAPTGGEYLDRDVALELRDNVFGRGDFEAQVAGPAGGAAGGDDPNGLQGAYTGADNNLDVLPQLKNTHRDLYEFVGEQVPQNMNFAQHASSRVRDESNENPKTAETRRYDLQQNFNYQQTTGDKEEFVDIKDLKEWKGKYNPWVDKIGEDKLFRLGHHSKYGATAITHVIPLPDYYGDKEFPPFDINIYGQCHHPHRLIDFDTQRSDAGRYLKYGISARHSDFLYEQEMQELNENPGSCVGYSLNQGYIQNDSLRRMIFDKANPGKSTLGSIKNCTPGGALRPSTWNVNGVSDLNNLLQGYARFEILRDKLNNDGAEQPVVMDFNRVGSDAGIRPVNPRVADKIMLMPLSTGEEGLKFPEVDAVSRVAHGDTPGSKSRVLGAVYETQANDNFSEIYEPDPRRMVGVRNTNFRCCPPGYLPFSWTHISKKDQILGFEPRVGEDT